MPNWGRCSYVGRAFRLESQISINRPGRRDSGGTAIRRGKDGRPAGAERVEERDRARDTRINCYRSVNELFNARVARVNEIRRNPRLGTLKFSFIDT